jgi:hypothetical protein
LVKLGNAGTEIHEGCLQVRIAGKHSRKIQEVDFVVGLQIKTLQGT